MIDDSFADPDFEHGVGSSSPYSVEGPCQENDAGACDRWRTDSGEDKITVLVSHTIQDSEPKPNSHARKPGPPNSPNAEAYARDS